MIVRCAYCGKEFEARRSSARYCSDTCQASYHQLPERVQTARDNALQAIKQLDDLSKYQHLAPDVEGALIDVQRALKPPRKNLKPVQRRLPLQDD